jgi:hypothetical protein
VWLICNAPALSVELCALFDNQGRRRNVALDVRGTTEHEFFGGMNVTLDCAIYLCDCYFDDGFGYLSARADDQSSVLRSDVPGEVSVYAQHRFEAYFTGEIYDVAYKPEPIVLVDIRSIAIDERRLAAFVSARNCWSSHCCLLSILFMLPAN